MNYIQNFNDYNELNEGWKQWAIAGMIGLSSLGAFGQNNTSNINPTNGVQVSKDFHQRSPEYTKKSDALLSNINKLDFSKLKDNGDGTYSIGDFWLYKKHNSYSNSTSITFGSGSPQQPGEIVVLMKQVDGYQLIYGDSSTTGFQVHNDNEAQLFKILDDAL